MPEYRFARPEEEDEILDFINLVFSQKARPHDFAKLLPKVYAHPGFSRYHAVAVENGRIRGTVAMIPLKLRAKGCDFSLRGGYIGSVSVHPRYERRGYMRALMDMQLQEAQRQSLDFVALGGQRQRYGYWGFEKCGVGVKFHVNEANVRHALLPLIDENAGKDDLQFIPVNASQNDALDYIARLQESQSLFCVRPRELLCDTLHTYCAQPYLIADAKTGAPVGYFTAFGDDISELALEDGPDRLNDVIRCWMKDRKSCSVHLSGYQPELIRPMQAIAENFSFSDSQMMRVLRWDRALTFGLCLAAAAGYALPLEDTVLEIQNAGRLTLSAHGEHPWAHFSPQAEPVCRLSEKQAVTCLFSSFGALYPPDPALSPWLPLPLDIPVADQF